MPLVAPQSGNRPEGKIVPLALSLARDSECFALVPRSIVTGDPSHTETWCVPKRLAETLPKIDTANWTEQSKSDLAQGSRRCSFALDSSHLAISQTAVTEDGNNKTKNNKADAATSAAESVMTLPLNKSILTDEWYANGGFSEPASAPTLTSLVMRPLPTSDSK